MDRVDQLRARFSLADGHTFKKWFGQHRFRSTQRVSNAISLVFVSSLCVSLIPGSWQNDTACSRTFRWSFTVSIQILTRILLSIASLCVPSSTTSSRYLFSPPNPKIVSCNPSTPPAPNPGKRTRLANCVVCHFERDARVSKHSRYCKLHKVSCCIKSHAILPNNAQKTSLVGISITHST